MPRPLLLAPALLALATLAGCSCDNLPQQPPINRPNTPLCDADLTPFLATAGKGAVAKAIDSKADLIGGDAAHGQLGDFLLSNDQIRLVVQAPGRFLPASPFGGQLIDADLVRTGAGRDGLVKLALLVSFGHTQNASRAWAEPAGKNGTAAVVVVNGTDNVNDLVDLGLWTKALVGSRPPVDEPTPLPLDITTFYVVNPGEARVRIVTAFCNRSASNLTVPVGDLLVPDGPLEHFNSGSCAGGPGRRPDACPVEESAWYGLLGDGVAYGYAPFKPSAAADPSTKNAVLHLPNGVAFLLAAGETRPVADTLASWSDPTARAHDGELLIPAAGSRLIVRDLFVGRDLGEVASLVATFRNRSLGLPMGDLTGTVTLAGQPVPGARVALERTVAAGSGTRSVVEAVLTTDDAGLFAAHLPAADYAISAWAPWGLASTPESASIPSTGKLDLPIALSAARTLTVNVEDPDGVPIPGKVTVLCETSPCPSPFSRLARFTDVWRDPLPDDVAAVSHAGASGSVAVRVPPGAYRVVVTRGPAWSPFPTNWTPADASTGEPVDLTASDRTVTATLAKVVDPDGALAVDLEIPAGAASYVSPSARAVAAVAEGLDVVASAAPDAVVDLAPARDAQGLGPVLSTIVGETIATFAAGHLGALPLAVDSSLPAGGPVDWAVEEAPGLAPAQLFSAARSRGAAVVQLLHPRGEGGILDLLRVDTDTLATHADPETLRVAVQAGADASNSKLLSSGFDAFEVLSAADHLDQVGARPAINDWLTFLSRGITATAVGSPGARGRFSPAVGAWRTWLWTDGSRDEAKIVEALRGRRAAVSNGPFVVLSARRADAAGVPTGDPVATGGTLVADLPNIEVAVDVQAPTWMSLTRIEVLTAVPDDSSACGPGWTPASTPASRIACDGRPNDNWPAEGIAASLDLTPQDAVREAAAQHQGVVIYRQRIVKRLVVARPAKDSFVVAVVRGEGSLFPLAWAGVDPSTHLAIPTAPFALTNAVLLDVDGGGFNPGR